MFNLKPHKLYPDIMSESKRILVRKNKMITVQEHYGDCHEIVINKWERVDDTFISTKAKHIPLNFYAFYILHIYKHLGKCHPDLRSKIYIGKPRERSK